LDLSGKQLDFAHYRTRASMHCRHLIGSSYLFDDVGWKQLLNRAAQHKIDAAMDRKRWHGHARALQCRDQCGARLRRINHR
jgi:hypothetical protein